MSIFGKQPDPYVPPPPPNVAVQAQPSVVNAGQRAGQGYSSLISTGSSGLKRKATTSKQSLIGGA